MTSVFEKSHLWKAVTDNLLMPQLLDACTSLLSFFDMVGSITLIPIKADIARNIHIVSQAHSSMPIPCRGVREFLSSIPEMPAQVRLSYIWLVRALVFVADALARWSRTTEELKTCFIQAYAVTLEMHHTWIQKMTFRAAVSSIPPNAYLMQRMHNPSPPLILDYVAIFGHVVSLLPHEP